MTLVCGACSDQKVAPKREALLLHVRHKAAEPSDSTKFVATEDITNWDAAKTAIMVYLIGYIMTPLSTYIKAKRKETRLTQADLSVKSGVGLRLIGEIEQGYTSMRMDKVNQVLALFGAQLVPAPKNNRNPKAGQDTPGFRVWH